MTYITEIQKKEIDKKYFPNGYFYQTKNFNPSSRELRLRDNFEDIESYEAEVKSLRHSNALRFFWTIKVLNETDFIKEINNQYLNYTLENGENAELWLSLTYDLVIKGFNVAGKIEDLNIIGAFLEWYNKTMELVKNTKSQKDYKKQKPFLIGLKFATGEAQELYEKYRGKESFDKLTIDLGFEKSDRTYFSSTVNNIKDGDKNLYNKDKLIMQIYNHCIENKIDMCDEFKKKYAKIESK